LQFNPSYPINKNVLGNSFYIHVVKWKNIVCKLLRSRRENPFVSDSLTFEKYIELISGHTNSQKHRNATNRCLFRANTNNSVKKRIMSSNCCWDRLMVWCIEESCICHYYTCIVYRPCFFVKIKTSSIVSTMETI